MYATTSPNSLFGLDDRSRTVQEPIAAVRLPAPQVQTDLAGWLAAAITAGQTSQALHTLRRHVGDRAVQAQALRHLAATLRRTDDDWEPRMLAVATVGVLESTAAAPLLEAVCQREMDQMARSLALPSPEAHYALTVLSCLYAGTRFDADAAFTAYLSDVEAVDALRDPRPALEAVVDRFRWRLARLRAAAQPVARPVAPARPAPQPAAPPPHVNRAWAEPFAAPRRPAGARPADRRSSPRWPKAPDPNETSVFTGLWVVGTPGNLPWTAHLAALIGTGGALTNLVVGLKVGGLFGPMAVLWVAGVIALFFDRRETWVAAIAANAVNALFLLYQATQPQPQWLSGAALAFGGLVALAAVGLLLHRDVWDRYEKARAALRMRDA